jgi:anti-anti-sigma factor
LRRRWVTVVVKGEIDLATAPCLKDALQAVLRSPATSVVVSMHGVTFCDSSGMHVLVGAAEQACRARVEMAITGVAPHVLRAFQLAEVESDLPLA